MLGNEDVLPGGIGWKIIKEKSMDDPGDEVVLRVGSRRFREEG